MSDKIIDYELIENVSLIRLNCDETRNAMTTEMSKALHKAVIRARYDRNVRAIIITGSGKSFCAGGDLKRFKEGWTAESAHALLRDGMLWMREIVSTPKPIIAAVNGKAYGAGFSLALASDIVVASKSAEFCSSFSQVGLIGDCGAGYFLSRMLGLSRAKEILFTSRVFDAYEAVRFGLALEVVEDDNLEDYTIDLACLWAGGPTVALGLIKELLNRSAGLSLDDYLSLEAKAQAICFNTLDHVEGVEALIGKRSPHFKGK